MLTEELVKSFKQKEVVVFVGAGLSIGTGLPSWVELMKPLAERLDLEWIKHPIGASSDDLLVTAQYFEEKHGRNALISYLQEALNTSTKKPTIPHELLCELPVSSYYTTNYDNLLEITLQNKHIQYNVVIEDKEIAFWKSQQKQVVKLCGDISRPTSLIVTRQDFNNYMSRNSKLHSRLKSEIEVSTTLFIGYSMQDPFIIQLWDQLALDFGSLQRRGYLVGFDLPELFQNHLRLKNLNPISLESKRLNKTMVLSKWLSDLIESI